MPLKVTCYRHGIAENVHWA